MRLETLNKKLYFVCLAAATVVYFLSSRLVQDRLLVVPAPEVFPGFSVRPEPYEIPLYFVGYFVIPFVAWGLHVLWQRLAPRLAPYRRTFFFGVLAILIAAAAVFAIERFAAFDIGGYVARRGIGQMLWLLLTKRLFIARLALLTALVAFVGFRLCWRQPTFGWLTRPGIETFCRKLRPWVPLILAVIVIDPNFSYDGHYNFVLGTVNDMLHGKALLYETTNQYGLLNIYTTAFLFRYVFPIDYSYLSLILAISYILFYTALHAFIRRWLRSEVFAVIGTAAIVAVSYFLHVDPFRSAMFYPGLTPFRYGFVAVVLLVLLWYAERPSGLRRELVLGLAAVALFWNFDTGAAVLIATIAFFAYRELVLDEPRRVRLRRLALVATRLGIYVAALFAVVNVLNAFRYGAWPNWGLVMQAIGLFNSGFAKIPLPAVGIFELFVFVYVAVGLWILWRLKVERPLAPIVVFVLMYGIFSFVYYVGTSAWGYLPAVSVPLILLILFAFHAFVQRGSSMHVWPVAAHAFAAGLMFVGFLLVVKIPTEFWGRRDYRHAWQYLTALRPEDRLLAADARRIVREFPHDYRIPLFHLNDAKLLILAGRVNAFPMYDQLNVVTRSDLAALIAQVRREQPPYVFVGRQRDERIDEFIENLVSRYAKVDSWRTVDIYQYLPAASAAEDR